MLTFFKRLFCRHKRIMLLGIEWEGEAVYKCSACGKRISRPL